MVCGFICCLFIICTDTDNILPTIQIEMQVQPLTSPPVLASQIQLWPLERVIPYERHARSHPDSQIAQIAASIAAFGFTNPIAINAGVRIIAGYALYLAARK